MKQYLLQENLFLWHLKSLCQKTVSGRKTKFYLQRTYICFSKLQKWNENFVWYHTSPDRILSYKFIWNRWKKKHLFFSSAYKYFFFIAKIQGILFLVHKNVIGDPMSRTCSWWLPVCPQFNKNLWKPHPHLKLFKVSFIEIIQESQQI